MDLKKVISDKDSELRSIKLPEGEKYDHKALAQLGSFREKALELHSREMAYPQLAPAAAVDGSLNLDELINKSADDKGVLTIFGQAPQGRHLFSSLPKGTTAQHSSDGAVKPLSEIELPHGMSMTAVLPAAQAKPPARVPNLGELFPAPTNLPPLEAPKPAKTTTKSKVLGFYHPELVDHSAYGHNRDSYYLKELTAGVWLDYSKAAPPTKVPDRRRERTLSENSEVSSALDSEVSELDTLFRGAFSSFAPEKDDSNAVISSGELGRLWYQRRGYQYMEQLVGTELDQSNTSNGVPLITEAEIEEIAQAVENWDESLVDPSLGEEGESSDPKDKDVEETLQEISDMIETLASYQRNRHLTLPTSQSRSATDPAKADTNGSLATEPSEEEQATYQMLKDQLTIIIASLPPYAVARLNSDRLQSLNVSTKIAVKSDVYKGVMEEDEASARLRHQQQQVAQAAQGQRQPQRAPSFHSAAPYQSGQSYSRQFQMQNQTPVPVPNYQQSPNRAQPPPSYQRQVSAPMAGITPQQHRSAAVPFNRPTHWTGQQSMQPLRGYGTPGAMPSYQNTPTQARAASSYQPQAVPSGTPGRLPPSYQGYTPQQQQQHALAAHYQQQQHAQLDNAGRSPQRNAVTPQNVGAYLNARPPQPQMSQRGGGYPTPGQPGVHPANIPRYPSNGVHPGQSPSPAQVSNHAAWTQLTPEQRERFQAQHRAQALAQTTSFNNKMQMQQHQATGPGNHHGVLGLGGIGISAQAPDMQKMHMRASQFGGLGGASSPSPRLPGAPSPAGMNGGMQVPSPSPGPSMHGGGGIGATPSPAPSASLGNPPTPVR